MKRRKAIGVAIFLGLLSQALLSWKIPPEPQITREWVLPLVPTTLAEETQADSIGFLFPEWFGFFTEDGRLIRAEPRWQDMAVSTSSTVRFDRGAETMVVLGIDGTPQYRVEGSGHPFFVDDDLYILMADRLSMIWFDDREQQLLQVRDPIHIFAKESSLALVATMLGNIYPLGVSLPFSARPPLLSLAVSPTGRRVFALSGGSFSATQVFSLADDTWKTEASISLESVGNAVLPSIFLSEKEVLFAIPGGIAYLRQRSMRRSVSVSAEVKALYRMGSYGVSFEEENKQWYMSLWKAPLQRIFHEPLAAKPVFFHVDNNAVYLGVASYVLKFQIFHE